MGALLLLPDRMRPFDAGFKALAAARVTVECARHLALRPQAAVWTEKRLNDGLFLPLRALNLNHTPSPLPPHDGAGHGRFAEYVLDDLTHRAPVAASNAAAHIPRQGDALTAVFPCPMLNLLQAGAHTIIPGQASVCLRPIILTEQVEHDVRPSSRLFGSARKVLHLAQQIAAPSCGKAADTRCTRQETAACYG